MSTMIKTATFSEHVGADNAPVYRIERLNNVEFSIGQCLTKREVEELYERRKWKITVQGAGR